MKSFQELSAPKSLYASWCRFRLGKRRRKDILVFERHLEDELLSLSEDLASEKYVHGDYHRFYVRDPKYRMIHKGSVRDRVVHQALYDALSPVFEKRFYFDSYSARLGKGTMRAVERILTFIRKTNQNGYQAAWVLHGDIYHFFDSINHEILLTLLKRTLGDQSYLKLCEIIIRSFESAPQTGLPLGNLTSQLFANVYLHELDYFVKQKLGVHFYARYNDDFFIVAQNYGELAETAYTIQQFLLTNLKLDLPPKKIKIRDVRSGVDVLGSVIFPWGVVPRKRLRVAAEKTALLNAKRGYSTPGSRSAASYTGLLAHMSSFLLKEKLRLAYLS